MTTLVVCSCLNLTFFFFLFVDRLEEFVCLLGTNKNKNTNTKVVPIVQVPVVANQTTGAVPSHTPLHRYGTPNAGRVHSLAQQAAHQQGSLVSPPRKCRPDAAKKFQSARQARQHSRVALPCRGVITRVGRAGSGCVGHAPHVVWRRHRCVLTVVRPPTQPQQKHAQLRQRHFARVRLGNVQHAVVGAHHVCHTQQ